MACEPHAALSLVSCDSCTHDEQCIFYVLFPLLNSVRHCRVRGKYGGHAHVSYDCNVALHSITIENAALSPSLVCHPCCNRFMFIILYRLLPPPSLPHNYHDYDDDHLHLSYFAQRGRRTDPGVSFRL